MRVIGRALLGGLVMVVALGTAGGVGAAAEEHFGLTGNWRQALIALVCSAIAVPLIILLRRRDRRPLAGLGLTGVRTSLRCFGLGLLVTGGSAVAVIALGTAGGLLRWSAPDWPTVVTFILVNFMIAFGLEALPEELTLRGYTYATLRERYRKRAFAGTIGVFLFMHAGSSLIEVPVAWLLGAPARTPSFAPPGDDPYAYAILIVFFGAALLTARIVTGSLWTAIALHLTFLTVNRITFAGGGRDTGWTAEKVTIDAELLVPGYLLATIAVFVLFRRRLGSTQPIAEVTAGQAS